LHGGHLPRHGEAFYEGAWTTLTNEIWTDCQIVDAQNFTCRKLIGDPGKGWTKSKYYEIYQIVAGRVKSCTYCVRDQFISELRYTFVVEKWKLLYRRCSQNGDFSPTCAKE
jgi:hypothetical protein